MSDNFIWLSGYCQYRERGARIILPWTIYKPNAVFFVWCHILLRASSKMVGMFEYAGATQFWALVSFLPMHFLAFPNHNWWITVLLVVTALPAKQPSQTAWMLRDSGKTTTTTWSSTTTTTPTTKKATLRILNHHHRYRLLTDLIEGSNLVDAATKSITRRG